MSDVYHEPGKRIFDLSAGDRARVLESLRRALQAHTDVVFAYVHGSILDDRPIHDVDVAISLAPGARQTSDLPALDLAIRLERALPADLRLPVDVRLLDDAPLGFRYHAFRGRLLVSRDDEARATMVERTVRDYLDREPILHRALKEAMAA